MKHCFIINPAAGKGALVDILKDSIAKECSHRNIDYEIYLTTGIGDASEYIKRYAVHRNEQYRFYACGGDGTLCETVNGAMSVDKDISISVGLIPSGTGNDFVRNFSSEEKFFDIGAQLDAAEISIDLIRCNDIYAINMVNIGFDCEVVVKTSELKRKRFIPSKLAYIVGLLVTLIKKPGLKAKVFADGQKVDNTSFLLNTYANGSFCGGGFHSNPKASVTDGKIDALFVNNISRLRFLSLVGYYKKGEHLTPKFERVLFSEKHDTISLAFDKKTNISVDGEIVSADSLELSVERQALSFLVPNGASFVHPKNEETEKKVESVSV